MNGEIVPFTVERRGEHQQAAGTHATFDEERAAILEANQRRVVGLRIDGHVTEETYAAPALCVAQRRVALLDRRDTPRPSTALAVEVAAGAHVAAQRNLVEARGARTERHQHRAAAF